MKKIIKTGLIVSGLVNSLAASQVAESIEYEALQFSSDGTMSLTFTSPYENPIIDIESVDNKIKGKFSISLVDEEKDKYKITLKHKKRVFSCNDKKFLLDETLSLHIAPKVGTTQYASETILYKPCYKDDNNKYHFETEHPYKSFTRQRKIFPPLCSVGTTCTKEAKFVHIYGETEKGYDFITIIQAGKVLGRFSGYIHKDIPINGYLPTKVIFRSDQTINKSGVTVDLGNYGALKASTRNANYLVDTNGMSLYIFDKDARNKSNCDAKCQETWPLFEGAESGSDDIKVLEGTDHLAYRTHPLYFFKNDKVPGDILGNNIKDVWHIIFAPKGSNDSQTKFSDRTIKQTYLTDKDGRSLYTFDKDDINISKCTGKADNKALGSCEARWPVFYAANLGTLPAGTKASDFGTIDRPDDTLKDENGKPLATKQTTYKGHPLYYWFQDKKAGDVKGDWVEGEWDLIELSTK